MSVDANGDDDDDDVNDDDADDNEFVTDKWDDIWNANRTVVVMIKRPARGWGLRDGN